MNKKSLNKFTLVGLLGIVLLSFSTAEASFTPVFLPDSTFWDGSRYYNQNGVNAYVEYAVYDTWDTGNPFSQQVGDGHYVYAYEVKNFGQGLDPIAFFSLIGGNPSQASGIGSIRDGSGNDVVPTNDGTSFVWNFENGVFIFNKNSAFMVFSSDMGPVAGSFKLGTLPEGGDEPPVNGDNSNVPEPASMALLAAGAFSLLTRRNK